MSRRAEEAARDIFLLVAPHARFFTATNKKRLFSNGNESTNLHMLINNGIPLYFLAFWGYNKQIAPSGGVPTCPNRLRL